MAVTAGLCCLLWIVVGTLACHPGWHSAVHAGVQLEHEGSGCGASHETDASHDEDAAGCAVCAVALQQVGLACWISLEAPRRFELPLLAFPTLAHAVSCRPSPEPPGRAPPAGA